MTRDTAIILLKIAGYHDDNRSFVRLYVENHISITNARLAFDQGAKMRMMGVPCHCHQCTETKMRKEINEQHA